MSAIAALTLANGEATPVNKTFSVIGVKNQVAKWQDKSGGISIGFPTVTFSLRDPSKANKTSKLTAKVVYPVLEVTSPSTASGIQPAPTKAYDLLATVEIVMPERATQADRKNIAAFMKNLLGHSIITAATADLEQIW